MHYGSPIPPKTCASSNRGYAKNLTRDKIDRNKVMGRRVVHRIGRRCRLARMMKEKGLICKHLNLLLPILLNKSPLSDQKVSTQL
jgi:hypothetical protein